MWHTEKLLNVKKKEIINKMDYTLEDKVSSRTKAQELLEKFKNKEAKIKFYSRKIGNNTIVYCKNEERLNEYNNSYNNIKIG